MSRSPARLRARYYAVQNVPLLLSLGLFLAMIVLYIILFALKQIGCRVRSSC